MKLYVKVAVCILIVILILPFAVSLNAEAVSAEKEELLTNLNIPYGVALDGDGNLYFTEYNEGTIKMLPKGESEPVVILSNLTNPYDLAFDKDGNLIFSEKAGGKLSVLTKDGGVKLILSDVGRIYGIAVAPDGYIYLTVFGNPIAGGTGVLLKTDLTGGSTPLLTELNYPIGIAVDSEGNIFFTEYGAAGKLDALFADGRFRTLLTNLNNPTGVAVDEAGNVYFSDLTNGTIKMLSADFSKVETIATNLTSPWDLAYYKGDLYAAAKTVNGTITQIHVAKSVGFTVSGTVTRSSDGSAVQGASVSLWDNLNKVGYDGPPTDASGGYSFSVPAGTYEFHVEPPQGSGLAAYDESGFVVSVDVVKDVELPTSSLLSPLILSGAIAGAVVAALAIYFSLWKKAKVKKKQPSAKVHKR